MSDFPQSEQLASRGAIPALVLGAAGVTLCAILGFTVLAERGSTDAYNEFFRSWLFAWMFWLGVSLGAMAINMLHHMTGGAWGLIIRRLCETAALVLPLMLILFIPIFLGMSHVYPWVNNVNHDPILEHRAHWLNVPMFIGRTVIYFVIWFGFAFALRTDALVYDRDVDAIPLLMRLRRISAAGIPIYFVTMTLAGVDWIMSRDPHWFSTVFGFLLCIGQALAGLCFIIIILSIIADDPPFKRVMHPNYLNDMGNVLLTFVILWAYLGLSQFLIIWLGNIQKEISWYMARTDGGWRWIGGVLILFHFLVPFIVLLQRRMKRKLRNLTLVAVGVFFIHVLHVVYIVTPTLRLAPWPAWKWVVAEIMNLAAWVGIGGLWIGTFLWILKGKPLLPIGDRVPVIPVDHAHGQQPNPAAFG